MATLEMSALADARRRLAPAPASKVDCNVVWLRGEHDVSTSVADSETLAHAIALNDTDLLVDLSQVRFMDGSTIRTLITARALLAGRSRTMTLRSPSRSAALVIRVSGLEGLIGDT